ncbi:MAG TPA: 2,3,4,5-tetrahydropyridine-2,6-dicarboxylate N-succinyltransferase [Gemmatimonadaceae bacterium]|nr:2,3,4,5-tetrahydropyridine-2,6-dicarboxylate N-succinyltransferase [Gemmatimonadaceae bacterium]
MTAKKKSVRPTRPASKAPDLTKLEARIRELVDTPRDKALPREARDVVNLLLDALEAGLVRAARCDSDGMWRAVGWVKMGILLAFRAGVAKSVALAGDPPIVRFIDKDTVPTRLFDLADGVRVVPGGSSVRRGAFLAPGVVCMPPMFVNIGAYVGGGSMIDSHALVGSCAQIGERVHLSAAAQVGGVLEPVNAAPVVIEDEVIVGGNCGVYEGTIVRARAVLAAGVVLTRGTPIFDLVRDRVHSALPGAPLEVPPGAVVVPGARAVRGPWAESQGLALQTPVIVKYRDSKTDLSTTLEKWLR